MNGSTNSNPGENLAALPDAEIDRRARALFVKAGHPEAATATREEFNRMVRDFLTEQDQPAP
jgi:hypothetical protein